MAPKGKVGNNRNSAANKKENKLPKKKTDKGSIIQKAENKLNGRLHVHFFEWQVTWTFFLWIQLSWRINKRIQGHTKKTSSPKHPTKWRGAAKFNVPYRIVTEKLRMET